MRDGDNCERSTTILSEARPIARSPNRYFNQVRRWEGLGKGCGR